MKAKKLSNKYIMIAHNKFLEKIFETLEHANGRKTKVQVNYKIYTFNYGYYEVKKHTMAGYTLESNIHLYQRKSNKESLNFIQKVTNFFTTKKGNDNE